MQTAFCYESSLSDGKSQSFGQKPKQVIADSTAYMITDMLRSVVTSGTGTAANISSLDVAGKSRFATNYDSKQLAKFSIPERVQLVIVGLQVIHPSIQWRYGLDI